MRKCEWPRDASACRGHSTFLASSRQDFRAEARSGAPTQTTSASAPRRPGAWRRDLSPAPSKILKSWMERSRARRRRSRPRGRSPRVDPPRPPRAPRETAAPRCLTAKCRSLDSLRSLGMTGDAPLARDDSERGQSRSTLTPLTLTPFVAAQAPTGAFRASWNAAIASTMGAGS